MASISFQRFADRIAARWPRWAAIPIRIAAAAATRWLEASAPQLGASIAFYAVFALAPLLIVTIAVAGMVFGEDAARGRIVAEIASLIGRRPAEAVESMILSSALDRSGTWATLLGVVTIVVGATGVFAELHRALDALSGDKPKPPTLRTFLRVRLLAFALLLGLGFLMIASLILSAVLAGVAGYLSGLVPAVQWAFAGVDLAVSTAMMTVAFAALLRWMPDRPASRNGVWVGALAAAALFAIGKYCIGYYLGRTSVTSAFGAAASFAVILLWTWYSSQILLFGAAVGLACDDVLRPRAPAPRAE